MGFDSMRVGGGRCSPLIVGGLLVSCLMLICNWWTLSSENIELLRQIDDLNEQLKISAEERDQCVTLRGNLEQRYKHSEDEVASLHVLLEQQVELSKKNEELEESVTICKSELDSLNKVDATRTATMEALRLEKDNINTQLIAQQEENKKLQEELNMTKDELENLKLDRSALLDKKPASIKQSNKKTSLVQNETLNKDDDQLPSVEQKENSANNEVDLTETPVPPETERDRLMKGSNGI